MFCDFNRLFLRRQHSNYDIPPAIDLKSIYLSISLGSRFVISIARNQRFSLAALFSLSCLVSSRRKRNLWDQGTWKAATEGDGRPWEWVCGQCCQIWAFGCCLFHSVIIETMSHKACWDAQGPYTSRSLLFKTWFTVLSQVLSVARAPGVWE